MDFFQSDWIKTGMKDERLIFRHPFNERTQKRLFYASLNLQKRFGRTRSIPADLQIMIGSQWWCLRRRTIEWILEFCRERPEVVRFFRTTWIPDETFFQTLVRHLIPDTEIRSRALTFLMFSDYGMPVAFYNDQYDLLLSQDFLFARKISPEAHELKTGLGELFASRGVAFQIANEGASQFKFLTGRGREGRRFAPRFWETASTLVRDRELLIITCKKWHVAKRLLDGIRQVTTIVAIEYVFDEEDTALPDLGGIQKTLGKRTRHRRALMRMLFDYYETDRLIFCLDPDNMDLLQDFYTDRSKTSLLHIDCSFSDEFLLGHARRVGLLGARTRQDAIDRLLPTIRADVHFEADRIRDANFAHFHRISEQASTGENAVSLAAFLDITSTHAPATTTTPNIFSD